MTHTLQLLLCLVIILFCAKLGGALSQRIGQPAVFGKLLIGVILGPTVINLLGLPFFDKSLGQTVSDLAHLGVILLMFIAGMETNLKEMLKVGKTAFSSAMGGVILPMLGGTWLSLLFGYSLAESIFIGTILTATSVSITAQTLMELGKIQSKEGTTILGAAVIDDVLGIIILSLVIGFERSETGLNWVSISALSIKIILFFALSIYLGFKFLPKLTEYASKVQATESVFAFTLMVCFFYAWAAEYWGGIADITGAYIVGIIFAQTKFHKEIEHRVQIIAYALFVPIFFVSIGLEADAKTLGGELLFVLLIVAFAIISKSAGGFIGARLTQFNNLESLRVGVGMISRVEVASIVALTGLEAKIIGSDVFSSMIIMTLVTTLVTPILLKIVFPNPKLASEKRDLTDDSVNDFVNKGGKDYET